MRVRFLYVRIWSYVIRRVASLRKRTTKRRLISYRIASFLSRSWLHAMCAAAFLSLSLSLRAEEELIRISLRGYTQAHCSVGRERGGAFATAATCFCSADKDGVKEEDASFIPSRFDHPSPFLHLHFDAREEQDARGEASEGSSQRRWL